MLKKNSSFNTKAKDRDIKRNKMTYYYLMTMQKKTQKNINECIKRKIRKKR